MKERIITELNYIAKMENITIIYACESGSRAWGFESKNSDYDIRFIYTRPIQSYFTLQPYRDVIDRQKGNIATSEYIRSLAKDNIDLSGWDIKKVLQLIIKGNPVLMEWLQSHTVYMSDPGSQANILSVASLLFQLKSSVYHYQHMAYRNFQQYIVNPPGDVIIKKYLYVLRSIYACKYITTMRRYPPMLFKKLYTNKRILKDAAYSDILPVVKRLIHQKKQGDELEKGPRIAKLDEFCAFQLQKFHKYAADLEPENMYDSNHKMVDGWFYNIVNDINCRYYFPLHPYR